MTLEAPRLRFILSVSPKTGSHRPVSPSTFGPRKLGKCLLPDKGLLSSPLNSSCLPPQIPPLTLSPAPAGWGTGSFPD